MEDSSEILEVCSDFFLLCLIIFFMDSMAILVSDSSRFQSLKSTSSSDDEIPAGLSKNIFTASIRKQQMKKRIFFFFKFLFPSGKLPAAVKQKQLDDSSTSKQMTIFPSVNSDVESTQILDDVGDSGRNRWCRVAISTRFWPFFNTFSIFCYFFEGVFEVWVQLVLASIHHSMDSFNFDLETEQLLDILTKSSLTFFFYVQS